jgi:hypothetical protein
MIGIGLLFSLFGLKCIDEIVVFAPFHDYLAKLVT